MDLIERIKAYFRDRPGMAVRVGVAAVVLAVGVPGVVWFVSSAEEKAYIYFTNGYYQYRNRMYPQAAGSLSQLISYYPNSKFTPMGRYYLGLTHLANGSPDDAASQFQNFIDQNPGHFLRERVFAIWMAVELNAARPEKCATLADRYFSEFGRATSTAPEVLYRQGVALSQTGNQDAAAKCFEEAAAASKTGNIFGTFAFYAHTSLPHI